MTSSHILVATSLLLFFIWIFAVKAASPKGSSLWGAIVIGSCALLIPIVLGRSGVLSQFDRMPPPLFFFLIYLNATAFFIGFSRYGTQISRQLPLWGLVGFQSFRILAELSIYLGLREGRAPVQLSFEGYNFDIVTGVTALIIGIGLKIKGRDTELSSSVLRWVRGWNWMGIGFLLIIAFIAVTSMPGPTRIFMNEPSNRWVTEAPYSLLPGVLVLAAITGHILALRRVAYLCKKS